MAAFLIFGEMPTIQKKTQFEKGQSPNPGGKRKAEVNLNSGSPEQKKREAKSMHARSTAGKIAAKAGVSRHKAEQAIAVSKADPSLPMAA